MLALGALSFWGFAQLDGAKTEMNSARNIAALSQRVPYATLLVRMTFKEFGFEPTAANANAVADALERVHSAVAGLSIDDQAAAQPHLDRIRQLLDPYDRDVKYVLAANRNDILFAYNGGTNRVGATRDKRIAIGKLIDAQANDIIHVSEDAVTVADLRSAEILRRIDIALAICVTLGLLVGVLASVIIARRLGGRLQMLSSALKTVVNADFSSLTAAILRLENGDLTARFNVVSVPSKVRGNDEVADITASYNSLVAGLEVVGESWNAATLQLSRSMSDARAASDEMNAVGLAISASTQQARIAIAQISEAIEGVANLSRKQSADVQSSSAAVEELAAAASEIAAGAADQAMAIDRAAGRVNDLDRQVTTFVSLGEKLAGLARDASAEAERGNEAVEKTATAIERLRVVSESTIASMQQLVVRSEEVVRIVSTIDDIADQTNLLALNAAIEAARAGEHGRGFAVVADEIRKLAERSTSSTSEIATILGGIRQETISVSDSMSQTQLALDDGLSLVATARDSLVRLAQSTQMTTETADAVADGSGIIHTASTEIGAMIGSVSSVIEENAAAVSQMKLSSSAVTDLMTPIASASESHAVTAEEVSASAHETAVQVTELDNTAATVLLQSERLRSALQGFVIQESLARAGDLPAVVL